MPNPKPKFTGRFAYTPFGAGGKEPIYTCPDGYQISMDQKECVPMSEAAYRINMTNKERADLDTYQRTGRCPTGLSYDPVKHKCVPVGMATVRHPEIEALHTRVCNYLKQHIADEEKESKKYRQLQIDLRKITNGHAYLDVLFQAQDEEVSQLKEAYRNYCKPGQR